MLHIISQGDNQRVIFTITTSNDVPTGGDNTMSRMTGLAPRSAGRLAGSAGLVRVGLVAVVILLVASGIALGYAKANRTLRAREERIAAQMTASVTAMLDKAQARQPAFAALLDAPCDAVFRRLSALGPQAPYTRAVVLVKHGRLSCSSALGPLDAPLSDYLDVTGAPTQLGLLPHTLARGSAPALLLYRRVGEDGVLYLIEGLYLTDLLSQGTAYGATGIALTVPGYGSLMHDGRFIPGRGLGARGRITDTSSVLPLAVSLSAGPDWIARDRLRWEGIGAVLGLCLSAVFVFGHANLYAHRRAVLRAARQGLRRGEFKLVYQPIVNVATGAWAGVEALVRWQHPTWGEVGPDAFIGEIENSPLIGPLTHFVLDTALRELGRLGLPASLHLAINIAPRDLERKTFAHGLTTALAASPYAFPLVLEITERGLLGSSEAVLATFATLRAAGIKFAIDDFGTAHSNIDLLRRFEFDFFKIDRQFVSRAMSGGVDLLAGISSLAKHLGTTIIAEGIEHEAQHRVIADLGIGCAQGYLYAKPMRAETLAAAYRQARDMPPSSLRGARFGEPHEGQGPDALRAADQDAFDVGGSRRTGHEHGVPRYVEIG